MIPRPFLLALLVVLPVVAAGCTGGEDEPESGPTTQAPGQREDTETFTLAAGASMEYKLFMQEGAQMEFSWSAPRAIYYDFHGDREGDTSGAFTRHKSGTAALDQGTFTSPFQGRHGWYWENKNAQPVTITLTTRGDYIIVGVVG